MGILGIVLLVLFIIVAILLILLVLVQNEEGDSLGGIFAGGSASAFGSRSGNVLTRATSVLGGLFLALTIGLALIKWNPGGSGVEAAGRQQNAGEESEWFRENPEPGAGPAGDASGDSASGLENSSLFGDTTLPSPPNPQE
jgi:preprotein translocase subunit SecG